MTAAQKQSAVVTTYATMVLNLLQDTTVLDASSRLHPAELSLLYFLHLVPLCAAGTTNRTHIRIQSRTLNRTCNRITTVLTTVQPYSHPYNVSTASSGCCRPTACTALKPAWLLHALGRAIELCVVSNCGCRAGRQGWKSVSPLNGLLALAVSRGEGPHVRPSTGVVVAEAELLVGVRSVPAAGPRVCLAPQQQRYSNMHTVSFCVIHVPTQAALRGHCEGALACS
jgi:hypothetical protein